MRHSQATWLPAACLSRGRHHSGVKFMYFSKPSLIFSSSVIFCVAMLVISILFYCHLYSKAFAFPLQRETSSNALNNTISGGSIVGWTEAPQVRGTFDLLLSCLTTLSLCAWTAYHPNVHSVRSEWRRMGHRAVWMLVAIFLPEVVLFCAWEQRWASRKLCKDINAMGKPAMISEANSGEVMEHRACQVCDGAAELEGPDWNLDTLFEERLSSEHEYIEQREPVLAESSNESTQVDIIETALSPSISAADKESSKTEGCCWTLEQAFFALSGGYAIDSSTFFPHSRLTFTPAGLIRLAKLGLLPSSSPETVSDKSKADYAAKIIVCIQAAWFLVQCIARVAQKLPLTLLELHVLTHVLCAFGMYLFWVEKPYDVSSPIICADKRVIDLAALWSLHVDTKIQHRLVPKSKCANRPDAHVSLTQVQSSHRQVQCASSRGRYLKIASDFILADTRDPVPLFSSLEEDWPSATSIQEAHLSKAASAIAYLQARNVHFPFDSMSKPYLRNDDPNEPEYYQEPNTSIEMEAHYVVPLRSNLLIDGYNAFIEDKNRMEQLMRMGKVYTVMATAYGGLHLAAWNFRFTTPVEMWMWRASGLVMVGMPVVSVLAFAKNPIDAALMRMSNQLKKSKFGESLWESSEPTPTAQEPSRSRLSLLQRVAWRAAMCDTLLHITFIFEAAFAVVALCCWVLYPIGRVYVLAESFAALRACERDVYRTVEWTNFIPHVG